MLSVKYSNKVDLTRLQYLIKENMSFNDTSLVDYRPIKQED